ncbi:hypothetical protein HY345_01645 [Candidatus Microgenomates bacterium]|nr:hypothetical protein [Candidatus Microgenomates bacterium]
MPPSIELGKIFTRENAWKATKGTFKVAAGTTLYLATGLPLIAPLGLALKIHRMSEERRDLNKGWEYYGEKITGFKDSLRELPATLRETIDDLGEDKAVIWATVLGASFGAMSIVGSEILSASLPLPKDSSQKFTRFLMARALPHLIPRVLYAATAFFEREKPYKTDSKVLSRLSTISQIAATITTVAMFGELSKLLESAGHTNQAAGLIDSDFDGIPDAKEIELFGDLKQANATSDFDGDGKLDVEEIKNGQDALIYNSTSRVCLNNAEFEIRYDDVQKEHLLILHNNGAETVIENEDIKHLTPEEIETLIAKGELVFVQNHPTLGDLYIDPTESIKHSIHLFGSDQNKDILDWNGDLRPDTVNSLADVNGDGKFEENVWLRDVGTGFPYSAHDNDPLQSSYGLDCKEGWVYREPLVKSPLPTSVDPTATNVPQATETPTLMPTATPAPTEIPAIATPTVEPTLQPTLTPEPTEIPQPAIVEKYRLNDINVTLIDSDGNGTIDNVNLEYPDGSVVPTTWIDKDGNGRISYGDLIEVPGGVDLDGDGQLDQRIYFKIDAQGNLEPFRRVNGLAYPAADDPTGNTDAKFVFYNQNSDETARDWDGDYKPDEVKVINANGQEAWVVDANGDGKWDEIVKDRAVGPTGHNGFPALAVGKDGTVYQDNNFDGTYETIIPPTAVATPDHFGSTKVLGPKGGIFGLVAQQFITDGYDPDIGNADQLTFGAASEINHKFFLAVEEMKANGVSDQEIAKLWYAPRGIAMVYPNDDSVYEIAKRFGVDDQEIDTIFSKYGLAV